MGCEAVVQKSHNYATLAKTGKWSGSGPVCLSPGRKNDRSY